MSQVTNFDALNAIRTEAASRGVGSKQWIEFATVMFDSFPAIYEVAKQMNERARIQHAASTAADNLEAGLRDLVATIDLFTDCMDNRIDRAPLEQYIARAEALVGECDDDIHPAALAVESFDLVKHIRRQRMFSAKTFGPGRRTEMVIDHIRKELGEIEAAPNDVSEWIDVILLAIDGAWRSGADPEQIAQGIRMKQSRNEARTWPDWRAADLTKAIEHVSEGLPAGITSVPMSIAWFRPEDAALFLDSELDESGAVDGLVVKLDTLHQTFDGGPYLRQAWWCAGTGHFVCSATACSLHNVKAWAYDSPDSM